LRLAAPPDCTRLRSCPMAARARPPMVMPAAGLLSALIEGRGAVSGGASSPTSSSAPSPARAASLSALCRRESLEAVRPVFVRHPTSPSSTSSPSSAARSLLPPQPLCPQTRELFALCSGHSACRRRGAVVALCVDETPFVMPRCTPSRETIAVLDDARMRRAEGANSSGSKSNSLFITPAATGGSTGGARVAAVEVKW